MDVEQHCHTMISGINVQTEVIPSPADVLRLSLSQGYSLPELFLLRAVARGFIEKGFCSCLTQAIRSCVE